MIAHVSLVLVKAALCSCFAEFQMFPGFDGERLTTLTTTEIDEPVVTINPNQTIIEFKEPDFNCTEKEKPVNIGSYEVPTERDLVFLVKKTLITMIDNYNRKALLLLRDIKESTKAATYLAYKCSGSRAVYRRCVRRASLTCSSITKQLMTSVEEHKRNITDFIEGNICNMAAMVPDPLLLIKMLSVKEVSLQFALPAFLRLLTDCHAAHCNRNYTTSSKKPPHRLSDQEFLVNHILTNNLLDFIKDLK